MNIQTIITKKAGQLVPLSYLEVAVQNCPDCLGIAIQDKDGDQPILDVSSVAASKTAKEIYAILEGCKDQQLVMILGKIAHDFNKDDDIQPFVFQQSGENEGDDPIPILAVFLEGDFPKYCKPGKGHSDEYNLWEELLFPTMLEKFQASQDVDDFFRRIGSSQFEQTFMNTTAHRGVMTLLPYSGDIIAFGSNEIGGEYDWGTTSNRFNWGDTSSLNAAAAAAVETIKKTGGRLGKLMGTTASPIPNAPVNDPPSPAQKEAEQKTNPPGVYNTTEKTEGDVWSKWPGTSAKTHQMLKPPVGLQGNARNRWIRTFLGLAPNVELPKGHSHKDFAIPVELSLVGFAQEDVSTNDDTKKLADKVVAFQKGSGKSSSTAQTGGSKDAQPVIPTAAPPTEKKAETRPASDFLPETPAEEGLISAELVTDWATNPKRPTALEVQSIEGKWTKFTERRGISIQDVARWHMGEKKEFVKKCPNDAALLISELMLRLHELGAIDTEKKVEAKPAEKQVEVPSTQPQPSPSQSTQPAAKKSRLAALKGAA